jgi:uncharacterized protein YciI
MRYFFYCRDNPGTAPLRTRLSEAHQAFMDDYVPHMVARGPTLTEDGLEATGSMHIVDLPDDDAARSFAFEEPNYKAGVYGDVMIRRWDDTLGRTMWEFDQGSEDGNRFLVIEHGKVETRAADAELAATHRDWIDTYRPQPDRVRLALDRRRLTVGGDRSDGRAAIACRSRRDARERPVRRGWALRATRGPPLEVRRTALGLLVGRTCERSIRKTESVEQRSRQLGQRLARLARR